MLNTLVLLSCGHTSDGQHGIYELFYDTIEPPVNHSWKSLSFIPGICKINNARCCKHAGIMHLLEKVCDIKLTVFV